MINGYVNGMILVLHLITVQNNDGKRKDISPNTSRSLSVDIITSINSIC